MEQGGSHEEASSNSSIIGNDSKSKFTVNLKIPGYTTLLDDGSSEEFEARNHVVEVFAAGYLMNNLVSDVAARTKWGSCQEPAFWYWNIEEDGLKCVVTDADLNSVFEKDPLGGKKKKNRFEASHEPGARKQQRCMKCGEFRHRENGKCPLNEPKKRKRVSKPKRPKIIPADSISPGSITRRLANLVEEGQVQKVGTSNPYSSGVRRSLELSQEDGSTSNN